MRKVIAVPSRTVDEWIVAINGSILYVTESRGINFMLNLYKFCLTVGMLWVKKEYLIYVMAPAVLVLLPYCGLIALGSIVVLGKALYITDEDLEKH